MNVIISARSLGKTPFVKLMEERDLQPLWERPAGRGGSSRLARPAHKISLLNIYKGNSGAPVVTVHSHSVECACVVSRQHKDTMMQVLKDSQVAFEAALAQKKLSAIVRPRRRRG
jgi:DNA-binding IscR family transcriptional regulator